MTQEMQVLQHINRYGKITSMKAFQKYGITRLAARIYTLRSKGYEINSTATSNGKSTYATYSMG
mgnify:CR=1 FL=1